jgi:dihydroorotate dehydrogenase
MPDWFYQTVSRPLLFRLPAATARDLALGFMGKLARLPLGSAVIDFLGHMTPDARLRCEHHGVSFPSPVGLGPLLDSQAMALPALARFGFGFIEVGPVTLEPFPAEPLVERRPEREALWFSSSLQNAGFKFLEPRLVEAAHLGLPLLVRIASDSRAVDQATYECRLLAERVAPYAAFCTLATMRLAVHAGWSDAEWETHVRRVLEAVRSVGAGRLLVCVPPDLPGDEADRLVGTALLAGVDGLLVDGLVPANSSGMFAGAPAYAPTLARVRHLRQRSEPRPLIAASGGIHEPEQALAMRRAGADLIQVDTGLVYTGPGLPKRINDALLFADTPPTPKGASPARPAVEMSWFWSALMGVGMLFGSVMALAVAATQVVLPYDEQFVGMSRAELAAINPRLLAFMTHDRVTLAGTMVAIGVLYVGLSLFGIRRGLHWAQRSVFLSAFAGFGTFFLFLGFGYFDPFHAFVTAILFQFLLLAVHSKLGVAELPPALDLGNDWRWRWGLWGQLLMILHACGLLAAGLAISSIGCLWVFVHEDLDFLQTTAETLRAANPRLIPLVAHDRASFGGMLIASGLTFLTASLWGYRRGAAWLWWTFAPAGLFAYGAAIGVHYAVGYTDLGHLIPAFAGLVLFVLGLTLSRPYLCPEEPKRASGGL